MLDAAVFNWYRQQKTSDLKTTCGVDKCEVAKKFAALLNIDDFQIHLGGCLNCVDALAYAKNM